MEMLFVWIVVCLLLCFAVYGWIQASYEEDERKARDHGHAVLKNLEELQDLQQVMNCLIDTAQRTTDLENVYDDSTNTAVSWEQVWYARIDLQARINKLLFYINAKDISYEA